MAEYRTWIDIAATPETVWDYLVTPGAMLEWMGQWAELQPTPGGKFHVDIAGFAIRGRYVQVDRPRKVVVSWGVEGSEAMPPGLSRVEFTLTACGIGTRLDLVHSDLPEVMVPGHDQGWPHFLARLARAATGDMPVADSWVPPSTREAP